MVEAGRGICSGHSHLEGASGDVVVPPLDDDSVASLVLDAVGDVVQFVAHVFDIDFLTGGPWTMDSHHQHVGTWKRGKGQPGLVYVYALHTVYVLTVFPGVLLTCFAAIHIEVILLP